MPDKHWSIRRTKANRNQLGTNMTTYNVMVFGVLSLVHRFCVECMVVMPDYKCYYECLLRGYYSINA